MNRFAELLDRLAYEPGRNNKLRLIEAISARSAIRSRLGAGGHHRRAVVQACQTRPDPRPHHRPHRSRAVRPVLRLRRRPLGNSRADVAEARPLSQLPPPQAGEVKRQRHKRQLQQFQKPATTARLPRHSPRSSPPCVPSARPNCRNNSRAGSTNSTRPGAGRC